MKNILKCIFISLIFFACKSIALAEITGTITTNSVRVRSVANTDSDDTILYRVYDNYKVIILDTNKVSGNGCSDGWYYISYNGVEGYICSTYVTNIKDSSEIINNDFDINDWPLSYQQSILELHKKYPTWVLVPIQTGLKFDDAVYNFSKNDKSYIWKSYDVGYRSVSEKSYNYKTDVFNYVVGESVGNWFYASSSIVAYYLDPRNFLTDRYMFMFEDLSYMENVHKESGVVNILGNTFMTSSTKLEDKTTYKEKYTGYSGWFMEAAAKYAVSPIHLAARVRQEMGVNGSSAATGQTFTYVSDGKSYTFNGLYNLFNIGAYGYTPPSVAGLVNANGGVDGSKTSCERPWTSPYKAILGGTCVISAGYISKGQETLYFQRFNVNPDAYNPTYTHGYATNISLAVSESSTSYSAYAETNSLEEELAFLVPIYDNMPETAVPLPNSGNPNNYLSSIIINDKKLDNFDGDITDYEIVVAESIDKVNINVTTVNANATVSGVGSINIPNIENMITLVVTAQNKAIRKYNIKVVKDDSIPLSINDIMDNIGIKYNDNYATNISNGVISDNIINNIKKLTYHATALIKDINRNVKTNSALATGDILTITSGSETAQFTIVVNGDNNGDAEVTIVDLLRIQKHLLKYSNLDGINNMASDVNGDGVVDIVDLLRIQKYLLGYIDKL